jgi:hypothetical protein
MYIIGALGEGAGASVWAWEEIVTEVTSLREMTVWGNGKDCDLVMSLFRRPTP